VGDFRAHPPSFQQSVAGAARVVVPGAASVGAARVDQSAVGSVGEQPARQILRADCQRAETARSGEERLEETGGSGGSGAGDGVGSASAAKAGGFSGVYGTTTLRELRVKSRALTNGGASAGDGLGRFTGPITQGVEDV